jgi:hypothetical protein
MAVLRRVLVPLFGVFLGRFGGRNLGAVIPLGGVRSERSKSGRLGCEKRVPNFSHARGSFLLN